MQKENLKENLQAYMNMEFVFGTEEWEKEYIYHKQVMLEHNCMKEYGQRFSV